MDPYLPFDFRMTSSCLIYRLKCVSSLLRLRRICVAFFTQNRLLIDCNNAKVVYCTDITPTLCRFSANFGATSDASGSPQDARDHFTWIFAPAQDVALTRTHCI